jgi:RHS repeat-associated protein
MVEQHSQTADYENRYKFTGHELDRETGLYYAGARYYDPKISIWLSVDPLLERGPEYSPYCYTFNNPINLVDPDGRWPDLPSWSSIKKSYNEAKSTVARSYKETKSSVARNYNEAKKTVTQAKDNAVKSTKTALNDGQKWVKDNKNEILKVANNMQDAGDTIAITGYAAAVVGAPIAGVGAAPGAALAVVGNGIGLLGSGIEIVTNLIAGDNGAAGQETGFVVGGLIIDAVVDRVLPGPTPDISKEATIIIKEGVNVKTIIAERVIKISQEENK